MSNILEETAFEEKEAARNNRRRLKEVHEDMVDNKQQMKNVHSSKFGNLLRKYEDIGKSMQNANTRELISDAGCLIQLTGALKGQAQTLCDVSARFNWQDLSASISNRFRNEGANNGLNWEKLGCEARLVFNCAPSFTTMVGPIHKEERIRKISVRRQRENTAGVVNATSEVIENNEEDGNDEATNARVAILMQHLESYAGQEFDLLRTLVDPVNPVQSVENFFDYSYLHKEKRVVHVVDEETGSVKGCVRAAEELDKTKKSQMVLSISMKDMNYLAKILYPDDHEQDTASQEAGPVSSPAGRHSQSQTQGNRPASDRASDTTHSSSSTGGRRSSTGSSVSTKSHPLHRDDPLYDAKDAQEQVRIITERAKLTKDQKDVMKTQQTQNQNQTQNTQSHTQGGSSSGAGVSRRTASGRAAQSVSAPLSQPVVPTESRRAAHARLNPNGSSSSSQWMDAHATSSSSNGTGTPAATRVSAGTPGTAASTGTAASAAHVASKPSAAANGTLNGHKKRAASPGLTPTPPRAVPAAKGDAQPSMARSLGAELGGGPAKRRLLGGSSTDAHSPAPASSSASAVATAPSTPLTSTAAQALLGMQTAPLSGLKSHRAGDNGIQQGKENNKRSPVEVESSIYAEDAFYSASDKDSQSSGSEFVSSARKAARTK